MTPILKKTSVDVLNTPVNDILPLSAACARLDQKMVDLLLEHGARPQGSCIVASCMGDLYLKKDTGPNWVSYFKNVIKSKDRLAVVRRLVEKGCQVDYKDPELGNGLKWVLIYEDWNVVEFLVDTGKTSIVMGKYLVQMMKTVNDKLCCKVIKSLKQQTLTPEDEKCLYDICIAASKRSTSLVLKTIFLEVLEPIMSDNRQPLHHTLKPNTKGQLIVELLSVQGLVDELKTAFAFMAKDADIAFIFQANPIVGALEKEQWGAVELLILNGFLPKGNFDIPSRASLKQGNRRERLIKILHLAILAIHRNYTILHAASAIGETEIIEEILKQPLSPVMLASLAYHPCIEAAISHQNDSYNMCLDKIRWQDGRDTKNPETILKFLSSLVDFGETMRYIRHQLHAHKETIHENALFNHISQLLRSRCTWPPERSFSKENISNFLTRYLTTNNIDGKVLILIAVTVDKLVNTNILEYIRKKVSTKDLLRDLGDGFTFLDLLVIFSGHANRSVHANPEDLQGEDHKIIESLITKGHCKIQSLTLKIANRNNRFSILAMILEAAIKRKVDFTPEEKEEWLPVLYNATRQNNKRFVDVFFKFQPPTDELVYECLGICIIKGNDELAAYLMNLRDIELLRSFTLPFGPKSPKTSILECLCRSRFFGKIYERLRQLLRNETLNKSHFMCVCRTGALELWTEINQSSESSTYLFEYLEVAVAAGHEQLSMELLEFKEFFSQAKIQEEVTKRGILHSACRHNMVTFLEKVLQAIEKTSSIEEALMTPDSYGITPLDYTKLMGRVDLYLKLTSQYSLSLILENHEHYFAAFGFLRFLLEENELRPTSYHDNNIRVVNRTEWLIFPLPSSGTVDDKNRSDGRRARLEVRRKFCKSEIYSYVVTCDGFALLAYIRTLRELIVNQMKTAYAQFPYLRLMLLGDYGECFKLLLSCLGDDAFEALDSLEGEFDYLVELAVRLRARACLGILMEKETILDYRSSNDDNILHLVAEVGDEEIIELMNDRCSADMRKAANKQGVIPAMVSAGQGNHKVVPFLLKGVDLDEVSSGHSGHNIQEQECIKCTMDSGIGWSKMYQQRLKDSEFKTAGFLSTQFVKGITSLSAYKSGIPLTLSNWVNSRRPWHFEPGTGDPNEMARDILMTILLESMGFNEDTSKLTEIVGDDIIHQLVTRPNLEELTPLILQELGTLEDEESTIILLKLAVQYNCLYVIKIIEDNKKEVILDSRNNALCEAFAAGHFQLAEYIQQLIIDSETSLGDHLQLLQDIQESLPLKVALSCGLTRPGEKGWNEKFSILSESDCLEIMCLDSFPSIDRIKDSALPESMIPEYIGGKKLVVDMNKFEKRCPGIAPVELKRRIMTEILQRYPRFICQESQAWENIVSIHVGCLNVSDSTKPDIFLRDDVLFDTVQIKLEDQGKSFHIECSNSAPKELSFEYFMERSITDSVIPDLIEFIKDSLDMELKIKVDWTSIYSQNVPAATILTSMLESVWSQLGGLQSILKSCSILMEQIKAEYSKELVESVRMLLRPITEIEVRYVQTLPQYTKYNYGKIRSVIRWEFTLQDGSHLMYNANNFPMYDILRTCYIGNNAVVGESYLLHQSNDILGHAARKTQYEIVINWASFSQMGITARKFFMQNLSSEIQSMVHAKRSLSVLPLHVEKLMLRNSSTRSASFSYSFLDKTISVEVHSIQNGNQWDLISNDYEREMSRIERELILEDENFVEWLERMQLDLNGTDVPIKDCAKRLNMVKIQSSMENEMNADENEGATTDERQRTTRDESKALSLQFKSDSPLYVTVSDIADVIIDSRLFAFQHESSKQNTYQWMSSSCTRFLRDLFENIDLVLRNNFLCSFIGYVTVPSGIWERLGEDEQGDERILILTNDPEPSFRLKDEDENLKDFPRCWRFVRFSKAVKGLVDRKSYLISFNNSLYHALDKTTLESCSAVLPRKISIDMKSSHYSLKFLIEGFDRERIIPGDKFVNKCREITSGLLKVDAGFSELWHRGLNCGLDITCDITGLAKLWRENTDDKLESVCQVLREQTQLLDSLKILGCILKNIHLGIRSPEDQTKNGTSGPIFIHPPNRLDILFRKEEDVHGLTSVFLIEVSRLVGEYLKTEVQSTLQNLSPSLEIQVMKLKTSSEFEHYINNCYTLCFSFCSSIAFIIDNFENPLEIICQKATKICLDPNVPGKSPRCIHYSKDTMYVRVPQYTIFPSIEIIKKIAKATKDKSCVGQGIFFEPLIIGNDICMKNSDSLNFYIKCKSFAPVEMSMQDMKMALQRELRIITTRKTSKQQKDIQIVKVDLENIHVLDEGKNIFEVRITPSPETASYQLDLDLNYFKPRHFVTTKLFKDVSWMNKSGLFSYDHIYLAIVKTCHCDSKTQSDKDATKERPLPKTQREFGRIHHQYYEGGIIIDFGDQPSQNFGISAPNTSDSSLFVVSKRTVRHPSASLRAVCRTCYESCEIRTAFGSFTNTPVNLNFCQ